MQIVVPEFAKNFRCTAAQCSDSCCQHWQIMIDPDSFAYYQQLDGSFGEEVRQAIVAESQPYFRHAENRRCAMLDRSGLCKLQKALGEQSQCLVCRTYPRFVRQYGSLREEGISLSCPEAVRLLLKDSAPLQLVAETGNFPIERNTLDANCFFALKQCRSLAFRLIQDRRYSFKDRLFLLLCFAEQVQYCLSNEAYQNIDRTCERFSSPVFRLATLHKKSAWKYHYAKYYRLFRQSTAFFSTLEILSPQWEATLQRLACFCEEASAHGYYRTKRFDFEQTFCEQSYAYEHILFASLFKYWLEAAHDAILLPKVQQCVVFLLLLREINFMQFLQDGNYDLLENTYRIARELEHNEDNLDAMRHAFLHASYFRIKNLKLMTL